MNMKAFALTVLMMTSLLSAGPQQTGNGSVEGMVVRLGTVDPIAGVNIEMRRVERDRFG